METSSGRVTYQENERVILGNKLRIVHENIKRVLNERGYIAVNSFGRDDGPYMNGESVGVLERTEPSARTKGLFRKVFVPRHHIGNIYFNTTEYCGFYHNDLNPCPDKKWIFEIYGRENLDKCKSLTKILVEQNPVEIVLILESEEGRNESYPCGDVDVGFP